MQCEATRTTGQRCKGIAVARIESAGEWYDVCAYHAHRLTNAAGPDGEYEKRRTRRSDGEPVVYATTRTPLRHWDDEA